MGDCFITSFANIIRMKIIDMILRKSANNKEYLVTYKLDYFAEPQKYVINVELEIPRSAYDSLVSLFCKCSPSAVPDIFDVDPRFYPAVSESKYLEGLVAKIMDDVEVRSKRRVFPANITVEKITLCRGDDATKIQMVVTGAGELR